MSVPTAIWNFRVNSNTRRMRGDINDGSCVCLGASWPNPFWSNDFVEVALLAGAAVLWLAFLRQETCCHEPERFDRLG